MLAPGSEIQPLEGADILDALKTTSSKANRILDEVAEAAPGLVGDAEALPWATGTFDRYTSAGSIEYWPHPQRAIHEALRVLTPGGKAMIIGPLRPTFWLSRFFADMWYLFPEEAEYRAWFARAGFEDVRVTEITPEWYTHGDRQHGLIMGLAVSGTKPAATMSSAWARAPRLLMSR